MGAKENKIKRVANLKIETIEELKFVCNDDLQDFFISLNNNLIDRKRIFYDDVSNLFFVEDMVTGTNQEFTQQQLEKKTNIIKAIEKGSFYLETDENTASNLRTSIALLT